MELNNYYVASAPTTVGAALNENIECDTAIVGAGFAGLGLAVSLLERQQQSVVVLEAEHVGYGASGRNGGFIFGGFSLGEEGLIRQHGAQRAADLYRFTLHGGELIKERSERYAIACDYNPAGVLLTDWFGDAAWMRRKQDLMRTVYGVDWQLVDIDQLRSMVDSQRYYGALLEADAAHFHPLKYCQGLTRVLRTAGVPVYENSAVLRINAQSGGYQLHTQQATVSARRVVIAGGGYIHGLPVPVTRAILPVATYVAVTEPLGTALSEAIRGQWAIYDNRFAFDYYRPLPDTRLLWGGRISIRQPDNKTLERWLRNDMAQVFPALAQSVRFEFVWQGLMAYMRHKMPYIHASQPGLYHLIGFGGHGVAPTSGVSDLLAAVLCGDDERQQWFARYQMPSVHGWAGSLAAQLTYWRLQTADWFKDQWYSSQR